MLLEVMRNYPETKKIFDRYGMGCRGCMGAGAETVRASAVTHGIDPGEFVRELNSAASPK